MVSRQGLDTRFFYFIRKKKLPRHSRIGAKFPYFIMIIFLVDVNPLACIL